MRALYVLQEKMPGPYIQETLEDHDGENRLVLYFVYVDVPGWPPDTASDFQCLRWEVKDASEWKTKLELGTEELKKVLGDSAVVARLYSFDSSSGRAIIQFSTKGPTDSFGGIWCLYTWRDWDLLNNREYRFIEISEDIFSLPEDKFATKCEEEAQKQQKRFAEQVAPRNR